MTNAASSVDWQDFCLFLIGQSFLNFFPDSLETGLVDLGLYKDDTDIFDF